MAAAKLKPCTLPTAKNGKHTWSFVKNTKTGSMHFGPRGSSASFRVVGVYRCACGEVRIGTVNVNAPGASL